MKKWYYRLLCRGKRTQISIKNKLYDVDYNVPFLSPIKYVVANDEDVARASIRVKLTDYKWTGFVLMTEMNKQN